jgi:hypothetical protein
MANLCKGCGAEIVWSVTQLGKRIPLDARPERRFLLLSDPGEGVRLVDTYQSHFATCPKAPEFRKGKAS